MNNTKNKDKQNTLKQKEKLQQKHNKHTPLGYLCIISGTMDTHLNSVLSCKTNLKRKENTRLLHKIMINFFVYFLANQLGLKPKGLILCHFTYFMAQRIEVLSC